MTDRPNINSSRELPPRFYVGQWLVDVNLQTISCDKGEITLEPKMMAVLIHLAESCGKSLGRDVLEKTVWKDTVVGYDALTSTINKLRKALGDNSSEPVYIKTVAKKGYCLIAPVTLIDSGTRNLNVPWHSISHAKWLFLGVVLLVAGISISMLRGPDQVTETRSDKLPTLVVLPFEDLSKESGQDYFSNGITADITTALSKLSGLFVISWSSAKTFTGGSSNNIRDIAKKLNVRYVLQGSIRRIAKRVRINTQLIDASNGVNLWAERYDRELEAVFDLQDEITNEIVSALSVTLTEQEKRYQSLRYTTNIDAYDKFLQGQAAYLRSNREANVLARNLFQSAIDKDKSFARAYSAMALTYANEYRFNWSPDTTASLARALDLANQAVTIDKKLPQGYWALGYIYLQKRNYKKSTAMIRQSLELDPNNSDGYVMLALNQMYEGDPESAIMMVNRAMNLNPNYPARYVAVLGQSHYYLGHYNEAIELLRDSVKRNSELITPRVYLIAALQKSGHPKEARWEATQLSVVAPDFDVNDVARIVQNNNLELTRDIQRLLKEAGL